MDKPPPFEQNIPCLGTFYRRVISHCFNLRTEGEIELKAVVLVLPDSWGPNLSKKTNTPNPSSNSKHSPVLIRFFWGKKPTSPNKINKIMGVCPHLRLNHLGLPNGAAGAFPAVHQTAALLFLHLGGWEWRVQFLPKFLGAKTKNKYFPTHVFFFFGGSRIFWDSPSSAPFLFGWMGKTCIETRADTTIRTCMIPKILLANLGNLKYKINVEEPWVFIPLKMAPVWAETNSQSWHEAWHTGWSWRDTKWDTPKKQSLPGDSSRDLFIPYLDGHQQPLKGSRFHSPSPKKSRKEPCGT